MSQGYTFTLEVKKIASKLKVSANLFATVVAPCCPTVGEIKARCEVLPILW